MTSRPRAADDFSAIGTRLEQLRKEAQARLGDLPDYEYRRRSSDEFGIEIRPVSERAGRSKIWGNTRETTADGFLPGFSPKNIESLINAGFTVRDVG